jgi:hypothetical protein
MADQMECVGLVNEVEDALVDDCIESIDDATVDLAPFSVALDEWRRGTDVADKSELAKDGIEKASPLAVIGFKEVKEDRHVVANVHGLNHDQGCRLRSIKEKLGVRGGRRMRR